MTVATAYRRRDLMRKHRVVMMKMTYTALEAVVCNTGLKIIYSYSVSPPSIPEKYVTRGVVAGGTITLTVTAPTAPASLYVTAYGI